MHLIKRQSYTIFLFIFLIFGVQCKKKNEDDTNISIKEMKKMLVVVDKYIKKFKKFKPNPKKGDYTKKRIKKDFIDKRNKDLKEFRESCQKYIDTKKKEQPNKLSMKGVYKSIEKTRKYSEAQQNNALLGDSLLTDSDMKEFEDWGKEISTRIWGDYY